MIRSVVVALFCLFCAEAHSKGDEFLDMVSPKQRSFLRENPKALKTLNTVVAEAFATRSVQIYYYYSSDKTRPIASHYYPTDSAVGIIIKAEQEALDEYLSILFECINSHGEPRFKRIFESAQKGEISRREFALEILKVEFEALGKMKGLLEGLNLSKSLKKNPFSISAIWIARLNFLISSSIKESCMMMVKSRLIIMKRSMICSGSNESFCEAELSLSINCHQLFGSRKPSAVPVERLDRSAKRHSIDCH